MNQGDKQLEIIRKYQKVFDTGDGKEVLYDILKKGKAFQSTLGVSQQETSRYEGQRELAIGILELVQTDISKIVEFIEQQKENQGDY